jgi:hypothetical protein
MLMAALAALMAGNGVGATNPPSTPVFAVAVSGDRSVLATSHTGLVAAWRPERAQTPFRIWQSAWALAPLALSQDGSLLAYPAVKGKVRLVSVRSGKRVRDLEVPRGRLDAFAFSGDGRALAIAGAERAPPQPGDKPRLYRWQATRVRLVAVRGSKVLGEAVLGEAEVAALAFFGGDLLVLGRNGQLSRLEPTTLATRSAVSLGTSGSVLAARGDEGLAGVTDRVVVVGRDGRLSDVPGASVERLRFLDVAGSGLALAGYEELMVVAATSRRIACTAGEGTLSPNAALLLAEGRELLVVGGERFILRRLDLATGSVLGSVPVRER